MRQPPDVQTNTLTLAVKVKTTNPNHDEVVDRVKRELELAFHSDVKVKLKKVKA